MGLTTDPDDPALRETKEGGQQAKYLVLSDEERARGFVRPVRRAYRHVGVKPKYPTRPLTDEEKERYSEFGYIAYEEYPPDESSVTGRFWTEKGLAGGCGVVTTMDQKIAETYARQPSFYGATFCVGCGKHLPVEGFVWDDDGTVLGS